MRSRLLLTLLMALLIVGLQFETPSLVTPAAASPLDNTNPIEMSKAYGNLPLRFEVNQGQTLSGVDFISRGDGYNLFLTPTEAVLALRNPAPLTTTQTDPSQTIDVEMVHMQLVGANNEAPVMGLEELPGKVNYFIGNNPATWRTNIPTYAKVRYRDVYPDIDLIYYGNQGQLEYDFVVAPGADPELLRLEFRGVDGLKLDAEGNLILQTEYGQVIQRAPIIYQETDGVKHEISGRYILKDESQVGFHVEPYDVHQPLIIDPLVEYGTYLGGSGSDVGYDIKVDVDGNAYVTGYTSSLNFPTANPFQATNSSSSSDVFVSKLNSDGDTLLYSTYIGGDSNDYGYGIDVDANGDAHITGYTTSSSSTGGFPTTNPIQATHGGGPNNWDAFVVQLNATGVLTSP